VLSALEDHERQALEAGRPVTPRRARGQFVTPCFSRGRLNGLLQLRPVPDTELFPRETLRTLNLLLGRGLDLLIAPLAPLDAHERSERERQDLSQLIEHHEWNVARAARALGLTRTAIYRRLRQLGIARPGGSRG
jgi:hypothetical protein